MVEPDTIIDGRYRVLSRLGSGGMADVYLAEDQLLGRRLAVKVLHHHFAEDQEFVERFRREASSAAALSHPNIVAIFDRGKWDGTYYIAMEYVPGNSLKALVREQGALDPVVAIDIVTQILQAAKFAHARGVIHRDLKPHNVILDEEGRARVTDFGIAHAGASDMTVTGSIMGTAQYLSPEQAQGHAVSATSDLYAVGVILYELLTGVVPFDGDSAVAIAFKQVSAQPPAPSTVNPAVPAVLDEIVLRALAKDPAARYANADEFIAALRSARARLPASPGTAIFATAPTTVASPGAAAHGVAPAGMALSRSVRPSGLLMAPGGPPTGVVPANGEPGEQDDKDDKNRRLRWALIATVVAAVIAIVLVLALTRPSSSPTVKVPSVAGQSEAAASAALRRAGLVPVPALTPNASVVSGTVIAETPPAGSEVGKGTHVTIAVSTGPGSSALPNVVGLTSGQATSKLKTAGFKPSTETEPSSSVSDGRVISTDPPAGTELQAGSQVTVVVSSGPAQTSVPDLVGQSKTAAEATLTNAKLVLGTVTQRETSEQSPSTVLEQSPAAGSSLAEGGTVDLLVAQAIKEIAVPNTVGAAKKAASSALERAGFKVSSASRPTTEQSQSGVVLEQSPSGGGKARKGSTVTITVGALTPQTTTTPTTTTTTTSTSTTPPPASSNPPAASG
jgi:eukaryotic-like serine/threonine-protein kinase